MYKDTPCIVRVVLKNGRGQFDSPIDRWSCSDSGAAFDVAGQRIYLANDDILSVTNVTPVYHESLLWDEAKQENDEVNYPDLKKIPFIGNDDLPRIAAWDGGISIFGDTYWKLKFSYTTRDEGQEHREYHEIETWVNEAQWRSIMRQWANAYATAEFPEGS